MVKFNDFEHAFKPIKVGNLVLKNRIQFAPMVSSLSTSTGAVSEDLRAFIEMQAKTGTSVITIGATPIDHINAIVYFGAFDVTSDDNIVDPLRLLEAARRYNAKLSVELVHAGRGTPRRFRVDEAIAPSPIPVEGGDTHIRAMAYADFERVKNTYCDVVERLHTATSTWSRSMRHTATRSLSSCRHCSTSEQTITAEALRSDVDTRLKCCAPFANA